MTLFLLALYGVIGIILLVTVTLKPKLFWSTLIVSAVLPAGLMIKGLTFVDEYFIGSVLLAGLLSILIGVVRLEKSEEDIWGYLQMWLFFFLIIYMIFQGLRGMIVLESLRKVRWVVYYGILGLITLIISKKAFPIPPRRKIPLIVSVSSLIYLILYLGHGLFTEIVRQISRFEVQPGEWSTTAYALFPLVIAIPSAIILTQDKNCRYQWVGWSTLIAAILATFYYFSRVSWFVIFVFLFVSLFKLRAGKVIFLIILFLFILSLYYGINSVEKSTKGITAFFKELPKTIRSICFWELSPRYDLGRKVHIQVGFKSIMGNWKNFLFGYGLQTHGIIISPHLKEIYKNMGFPELAEKVRKDESTEGFTAMLVDTGVFGMLLLGTNFLFVARKIIIQKKNPYRTILLLSLLFTFLWLPVINIVDIMLFYLLIMPQGLILQLNRFSMEEQTLRGNYIFIKK